MEESSNGHIVPPESGPEESAGHHRSHLQGKKKRLRESAERPRGLSGPDQICTDDFSSEKKKREKSLDITSKAEEGQREESARWQKNDMSNPDERLKVLLINLLFSLSHVVDQHYFIRVLKSLTSL